ncbi:hypothetical protein EC3006_5156 [Escherichia coli 3006]|nr:hypothetical protein EC3006_5156 [Escherichia coli 3006]
MAVAASARNALKTPLAAKPLPDAKKCVTKPLSAFLASFLLLCRYTRCQIRAQSSLINLRLSFD